VVVPDESLLIAAFSRDGRGPAAWNEWSSTHDLSSLDPRELRLLPPVYKGLRGAGVADADISPIVKQMSRSMFVRTRLLLHQAAQTVELLAANGIESVLLKGAALVAGGFIEASARPMADFDVLIRPADAIKATALLREHRWIPRGPIDENVITFLHAALFKKGDTSCDLHWAVFWESRDNAADERMFAAAVNATLDGKRVRIPPAEELLLTIVVHGTRRIDDTSVRWVGDALAVLGGPDFDWDLFTNIVNSRRLAYPVGDALAYLVETFGAAVPGSVIDAFRAEPVRSWQRRMYKPRPCDPHNASVLNTMYFYFGTPGDRHVRARLRSIWTALQTFWGVPARHLPAEIMRRGFKKVFSRT
jgi:hypothetical protein